MVSWGLYDVHGPLLDCFKIFRLVFSELGMPYRASIFYYGPNSICENFIEVFS